MRITALLLFLLGLILTMGSCKRDTKWEGQKPIQVVPTSTLPIQKQYKGTFELDGGISVSNDFTRARLNGIAWTNDTLLSALITPENTPINPSPWYAFKIWAEEAMEVNLQLTYLEGYAHRYYPKLSIFG